MASPVVQVRVPEDMLAAVDGARGDGTRSAWILALIERELLDGGTGPGPAAPPPGASSVAAIPRRAKPAGVVCMAPGCWQRDTLPLRPPQAPALPSLRERFARRDLPAGDPAQRGPLHARRRLSVQAQADLRERHTRQPHDRIMEP